MSVTRTIHTGLYGDRAFEILQALLGVAITHYKPCKKTMNVRSLCALKCERNIDNEIIFTGEFDGWRYRNVRVFDKKSDEHVLNHLAWIFKNMFLMTANNQHFVISVKTNRKDFTKQFWNRKNTVPVKLRIGCGLEVNASEIYYLYEQMKNRKRLDMHYAAELIEQMVGVSLDPITIEMKSTINTEIKRLEEEREQKVFELNRQKQSEIKFATDTICKKFDVRVTDMRNEYHSKILVLQKELKSLTAVEAIV